MNDTISNGGRKEKKKNKIMPLEKLYNNKIYIYCKPRLKYELRKPKI